MATAAYIDVLTEGSLSFHRFIAQNVFLINEEQILRNDLIRFKRLKNMLEFRAL